MGARNVLEPGHKPFEFRHGLTTRPARGMNRTKDPGALPVDQFFYLQNVRIVGDSLETRYGQSKLFEPALEGCILGIFDDSDTAGDGERLLYKFAAGDVDKTVDSHDQIDDVTNGILASPNIHSGARQAVFYKGFIITGTGPGLHGKTISGESGTPTSAFFEDLTDPPYLEDGAVLWHYTLHLDLVVAVTQFGSVFTWDGESSTLTEIGTNLGPNNGYTLYTRIASHRGELFFGSGDIFRVYNEGSWDSITLPAFTKFETSAIQGFQQHVYISGFEDTGSEEEAVIMKYDFNAGTLSVVNTPSGGTIVHDMTLLGDYLYYAWTGSGGSLYIGRFDGLNWDDTHKNITAQFATVTAATVYRLHTFNNCLWLGHGDAGTERLLRSPADDVDGTWTALESASSAIRTMINVIWPTD